MEKEKDNQINNRMIQIQDNIKSRQEDIEEEVKVKIEKIIYYKNLELAGQIDIENSYVVRMTNEQEKQLYEIYDDTMLIATVDENGLINFSEEYRQMLLESENGELLIQSINEMEKQETVFTEPEELTEEDKELSEQEIEEEKEKMQNIEMKQEQEEEQEQEAVVEDNMSEEEKEEEIAKSIGVNKSDINAKSKINPKQLLTKGEMGNQSFEEVAGIEGKYIDIYVVRTGQEDKNKKFSFVGIKEDGTAEPIEELPTRGTTQTDRRIYSINRDGTEVEEKQTLEMFATGDKKKNFTVTLGQYGNMEINYVRWSPEENKYIGSPVENEIQRPTKTQVQQLMDEHNTTREDLKNIVENTKENIQEVEETDIRNIDENPYNDVALDIYENIELHDGTITTIAEQSEKLGVSIDEYKELYENTIGDCPAEKIEKIANEQNKENEKDEHIMEREERLTPEEEALRRLKNEE